MNRYTQFLEKCRQNGNLRNIPLLRRLPDGRIGPAADSVGASLIDFSSNDYLALSKHPEIIKASNRCLEEYGAGAGAARLMSGNLTIHRELENKAAELQGKEAALLFGSGYLANTGVIPALVGRGDAIFSDRLNHASLYDGCRLSGARLFRFRHNDHHHLAELLAARRASFRQALIMVESIYSMDGDFCPLGEIIDLKQRHDCLLMVDEAHATGIYGRTGGGLLEAKGQGAGADLIMGTFGKALGSYGAYVASSEILIRYLVNRARTFIFSTALPPAVIGASLAALDLVGQRPEMREEVHRRVGVFKELLRKGGFSADTGPSQIVPIRLGNSELALQIARELQKKGIYATAVRPPTVPANTARLRFTVTLHHSEAELEHCAGALLETLAEKQAGRYRDL